MLLLGRAGAMMIAVMALLTACESRPGQRPPIPPPTAAYTTWRGLLPGTPDSLTLHVIWEPGGGAVFAASLTTDRGLTTPLWPLPTAGPDSLAWVEGGGYEEGATWRLRRQGGRLTGTRDGQPGQWRLVRMTGESALVGRAFRDSLAAGPPQPGGAVGRFSLRMLLPADSASALYAGVLAALRGDTLPNPDPPTLAAVRRQEGGGFFRRYRADLGAARQRAGDSAALDPTLNYEHDAVSTVLWNADHLLTLGFYTYVYLGGAHGNYATRLASFDSRTGRRLRFADVFRPGAEPTLSRLLDQAIRRQLGIHPDSSLEEQLFVRQMPVTHNVGLVPGGVVFDYVPYEIASFAQGEIRVVVPYAALRPWLQPGLPLPRGH